MLIMIAGFYTVIAIIMWKLSALVYRYGRGRWFADELKIVRVVVFIFLCGTPYYFYLFEKISFYVSCSTDDIKHPLEKIKDVDTLFVFDRPETLVKNILKKYGIKRVVFNAKDMIRDIEEFNVENIKLRYMILNGGNYQFQYDYFPSLGEVDLGVFVDYKGHDHYHETTYFLYNFYHEKRISSVTMRSFRRSDSDILYYLLPYSFKGCESVLLEDENTRLGLDYLFSISFSQSK